MTVIAYRPGVSPEAPLRTADISAAEALLLGLFRRWVVGALSRNPAHWERLWRDIGDQAGSARAPVVVAALEEWLCALARGSVRPITYHPPCCTVVSPDEDLLLRQVAYGQTGDRIAAARIGRILVDTAGAAGRLADAATDLGDSLLAAGLVLGTGRTPGADTPAASRRTPLGGTLH